MTTIERTSHFSPKQTSVDPEEDISRQLQLFQTLSKAYMKHYCKIEVKLDNTYGLANHIETLAKVGDEIEAKHRTLFKGMLKRLEIAKQPLTEIKEILHRVFDEMFADNHFNWGRIVTVFVFGACVSKCLIDNKKSELAESVADYVGESVHNRAHKWVAKQGGWDAFVDFFRARNTLEDTVWNGLKYTLYSLGALAHAIKNTYIQ